MAGQFASPPKMILTTIVERFEKWTWSRPDAFGR
jgi:hypothetical protein